MLGCRFAYVGRMTTVANIAAAIARIAPPELAEDWDNTGLLLGDPRSPVTKVMTCLTITPESATEAIDNGAQLIASHHPLPFRAVKQITTTTRDGELMWRLARAGVAVYSPHTAFDSAAEGINRRLAERLGLVDIAPLTPNTTDPTVGAGRVAKPPAPLSTGELCQIIRQAFGQHTVRYTVRYTGDEHQRINRIGFACGSGGSLLDAATAAGCDALVTGEATFHTCLAAESAGVALVLMGHYASERFAVEWLAEKLSTELPEVEFWASKQEQDPLQTMGP